VLSQLFRQRLEQQTPGHQRVMRPATAGFIGNTLHILMGNIEGLSATAGATGQHLVDDGRVGPTTGTVDVITSYQGEYQIDPGLMRYSGLTNTLNSTYQVLHLFVICCHGFTGVAGDFKFDIGSVGDTGFTGGTNSLYQDLEILTANPSDMNLVELLQLYPSSLLGPGAPYYHMPFVLSVEHLHHGVPATAGFTGNETHILVGNGRGSFGKGWWSSGSSNGKGSGKGKGYSNNDQHVPLIRTISASMHRAAALEARLLRTYPRTLVARPPPCSDHCHHQHLVPSRGAPTT
jgi:hypothetical protein